ncbi:MAG: hypothetical protein NTY39_10830 [Campylobacterales bacterium]|nr:hypothetical protein [Campylobacterales bacterium]
MKLVKMSLVAVIALGTSAFAVDNLKVNGEAKVYYQTTDVELSATELAKGAKTGMFEKGSFGTNASLPGAPYGGAAAGGASLVVGATADLLKGVSAGVELQSFTTLGLENNLVNDTMAPGGATRADNSSLASQAWIAATLGKTTAKLGRQELDTPLAFTEKWNIVKNTFEAAVLLNNDLPDTTLVAAWVGKHNGFNDNTSGLGVNLLAGSTGRTTNMEDFNTFGTSGAYAVAAVNKSVPNTTLQAWYYNVVQIADAIWLQGDTKIAGMINLGAQYAILSPKTAVDKVASTVLATPVTVDDSKIWALKAGVDVSGVNVYAAYSQADKDGGLGFANVSTGDKTKIYTGDGSIYMDGVVTAPGAKAYKVGASTKVMDIALSTSYCAASDLFGKGGNDISAWDVSASAKVGLVGLTAIYTQVSNDTATQVATLQPAMYGGRNIDSLRLIASLKF